MSYTIATTKDIHSNQSVDISKEGNCYSLCFQCYDGETPVYKSKKFHNLADALIVYQNFVEMFIMGDCDAKTRSSLLD